MIALLGKASKNDSTAGEEIKFTKITSDIELYPRLSCPACNVVHSAVATLFLTVLSNPGNPARGVAAPALPRRCATVLSFRLPQSHLHASTA